MKKSKETRSRILREFNRQIYLHGYEKTTLKGIGEELHISTGHIYYYFKKKEELYLALNKDLIGKVFLIIHDIPLQGPKPVVKVLLIDYIIHILYQEKKDLQKIACEIVNDSHLCDEYSCQYVALYQKAFREQKLDIPADRIAAAVYEAFAIYWTRIRLGQDGKLPLDMEALRKNYFHDLLYKIKLTKERQKEITGELKAILEMIDVSQIIKKIYEMDQYNYGDNEVMDIL